jgi:hypothetical protein
MTDQIQEIKHRRFQYLKKLYEITGGSEYIAVSFLEIGRELGFSASESDRIDDFLAGEGLIKPDGIGPMIVIKHEGIKEIEKALSKPDEPTEHFLPINYIYVEQMNGSQIQQGSNQSTQNGNYSSNDFEAILKFIADLKGKIAELKLDRDTQKEANSEIETIESQIRSPRPKSGIIKECLLTIRSILEGAAGNVIAGLLLQQIILLLK